MLRLLAMQSKPVTALIGFDWCEPFFTVPGSLGVGSSVAMSQFSGFCRDMYIPVVDLSIGTMS
jgi:hypothetical protein